MGNLGEMWAGIILIDGIQPMEDIIKAYYERQGVAEFYEKQIPK